MESCFISGIECYKIQTILSLANYNSGNTVEYKNEHNDSMESDFQSSYEDSCWSSDSCYKIDVANAEQHKHPSISKQEQIDRKIFS